MSRDSRKPRNVFSQLVKRFAPITLGFLTILVIASCVFVYQVSPLRDSSFQPNDVNAGSLVPWLRGVSGGTWLEGFFVLSCLLSTNLVLILWQGTQSKTNTIPKFLLFILWSTVGLILAVLLQFVFLCYLSAQWLVGD